MPASRATSRRLRLDTPRCGPSRRSAAASRSSREMEALRPRARSDSSVSRWVIAAGIGVGLAQGCIISRPDNILSYLQMSLHVYSAGHDLPFSRAGTAHSGALAAPHRPADHPRDLRFLGRPPAPEPILAAAAGARGGPPAGVR